MQSTGLNRRITLLSAALALALSGGLPGCGDDDEFTLPLLAAIEAHPVEGYAPHDVDFIGHGHGGYPPYTYYWFFETMEDGEADAETKNASHLFEAAGRYLVRLLVKDSHGQLAYDDVEIRVNDPVPLTTVTFEGIDVDNGVDDSNCAVAEQTVVELTAHATDQTDPDNGLVWFDWTVESSPMGGGLSWHLNYNALDGRAEFHASYPGEYVIRAYAMNVHGDMATRSVTINVEVASQLLLLSPLTTVACTASGEVEPLRVQVLTACGLAVDYRDVSYSGDNPAWHLWWWPDNLSPYDSYIYADDNGFYSIWEGWATCGCDLTRQATLRLELNDPLVTDWYSGMYPEEYRPVASVALAADVAAGEPYAMIGEAEHHTPLAGAACAETPNVFTARVVDCCGNPVAVDATLDLAVRTSSNRVCFDHRCQDGGVRDRTQVSATGGVYTINTYSDQTTAFDLYLGKVRVGEDSISQVYGWRRVRDTLGSMNLDFTFDQAPHVYLSNFYIDGWTANADGEPYWHPATYDANPADAADGRRGWATGDLPQLGETDVQWFGMTIGLPSTSFMCGHTMRMTYYRNHSLGDAVLVPVIASSSSYVQDPAYWRVPSPWDVDSEFDGELDGIKGHTGDSGGWAKTVVDLSPFAGQTVWFGFATYGDGPGWAAIDKVMVEQLAQTSISPFVGWGAAQGTFWPGPIDRAAFTNVMHTSPASDPVATCAEYNYSFQMNGYDCFDNLAIFDTVTVATGGSSGTPTFTLADVEDGMLDNQTGDHATYWLGLDGHTTGVLDYSESVSGLPLSFTTPNTPDTRHLDFAAKTTEEASPTHCADGIDNDCDGLPDCAEENCWEYVNGLVGVDCRNESDTRGNCLDGVDNDADRDSYLGYSGFQDCEEHGPAMGANLSPYELPCRNQDTGAENHGTTCDAPEVSERMLPPQTPGSPTEWCNAQVDNTSWYSDDEWSRPMDHFACRCVNDAGCDQINLNYYDFWLDILYGDGSVVYQCYDEATVPVCGLPCDHPYWDAYCNHLPGWPSPGTSGHDHYDEVCRRLLDNASAVCNLAAGPDRGHCSIP